MFPIYDWLAGVNFKDTLMTVKFDNFKIREQQFF